MGVHENPGRRALAILIAGLLGAGTGPALAQGGKRATTIEEIIVTAQKREQSLQQTTVSMTALSEGLLEAAAVPELASIEALVPNLNFRIGSDGGSSTLQAFIRGVGQFDFAITTDPGVGVYLDGVYMARTVGANLDFADIHQVQVLRGPQGTLYGKNTIGGAINVVTRAPTGELDGSLEATYGSDEYVGLNGYLEFPLSDTLAGSVSVLSKQSDGWQSRNGDDAGDDDLLGGRAHLNWMPSERFSSHLVVDAVTQDQNVYPRVLATFNPNQFFPFLYNTFVSPTDPCCTPNGDIDKSTVLNAKDKDELDTAGASWTNSWEFSGFTLKSITGYRTTESKIYRDSDNDPKDYFSVATDIDHDQFSQEFLFSGLAMNERLDWVAGLYYFGEDGDHATDVTVASGLYEALSQLPLDITLEDGTPIAFLAVPLDLTLHYDRNQKTDSYSAYFHTIYSFTDRLRMTLALRYTDEEKKLSIASVRRASQTAFLVPGPTDPGDCSDITPRGNGSYFTCKKSWDEFSPKVGLDYDFTDSLMGYVQVSQGFRSGAFNGRPTSAGEISIADPETLTSYEVGFKSEWLDNRLVVNGAIFYNDYEDQQFLVNRSSAALGGGLALIVENAGDSSVTGAELEFTAVPVEGLTLRGGLGYIDAEFDSFETVNPATGEPEDLSDREFQDTPEWTFNLGAEYEFVLADGSSLRLLANAYYKDDVYYTNDKAAADYELLHPDGFTTYDAGIIFTTPEEHWQVAVHGRNLGDEREINGGFTVDAFGSTDVSYTPPRRYYLSVKYQM
jgi:iron complex outermembrane receptor protein